MLIQQYEIFLEEESKAINATCNQILRVMLSSIKKIDYSLVIAAYFKIIEIEIQKKVFDRFSAILQNKDKSEVKSFRDEYSREIESFVKFLKTEENLSLGEMLLVLKGLGHVVADPRGDVYSKLKAYMRNTFLRPYYFYGKQKLAERILLSVQTYRNPAVHRTIFTQADFMVFSRLFFGNSRTLGLLNLTIKCLMPKC